MMPANFVIFLGDESWQVGFSAAETNIVDVPLPPDATAEQRAQAARRALTEAGWIGSTVTVCLPSRWCFCAAVANDATRPRNRRQVLLYRMEEQLPFSAEQLIADFVDVGNALFGVAMLADRLLPILQALESQDVPVEAIVPSALLALQGLHGPKQAQPDTCIWASPEQSDLMLLDEDGRLTGWFLLRGGLDEAVLHVGVQARDRRAPLRLLAVNTETKTSKRLAALPNVNLFSATAATHAAAVSAAGDATHAAFAHWIDLRRDPTIAARQTTNRRGPLPVLIVAATIFFGCLSAALFWRAHQYARLADQHERDVQLVFRQALPDQAVPADPRSRLASEERKLGAASGLPGGIGQARMEPSALLLFRDALLRLPRDVRYRAAEIRVTGQAMDVTAQARSHQDAEAVAAALRSGNVWQVDLPRTEQPDGAAVNFTLRAIPVPAASPQRSAAP